MPQQQRNNVVTSEESFDTETPLDVSVQFSKTENAVISVVVAFSTAIFIFSQSIIEFRRGIHARVATAKRLSLWNKDESSERLSIRVQKQMSRARSKKLPPSYVGEHIRRLDNTM